LLGKAEYKNYRPLLPQHRRLQHAALSRTEIFELMSELRLYGMRAAYDEIMATGIKRQHEPPRIVGDLLQAEVSEKQARSIKYQIRIAKLPLAKDLDDFEFEGTPINERLVRDLAQGDFLAEQRNCVLVGGTCTGKTHLAIAIARSCIRAGRHGRFYNTVDLVNRLEAEARRQGRIAEYLTRRDFVVLDELGYLPFAQTGGQLLSPIIGRFSTGRIKACSDGVDQGFEEVRRPGPHSAWRRRPARSKGAAAAPWRPQR
jgi:DNA replication protein DnaC